MAMDAEREQVGLDLSGVDDHGVLAGGVADGVAEAAANGRRWARLVELHRRREGDHGARRAVSPHFTMTPRAETVTEVTALWGLTETRARQQLNVALFLLQWFPGAWAMCLAGQLDGYRAGMIADHVRHAISDPVERRIIAARLEAFLAKHLSDAHGLDDVPPVVACTAKQLRNKLTYEIARLRTTDAQERHRRAHADRKVRASEGEDGMGHLGITATIDQVRIVDHRLTLAARQLRRDGDERTIAQLRSDLAIDLLAGRGAEVPTPAYARPVVNLTVPIQTAMGLADDPGVLSGGTVVPAGLARAIAADPDSTWYRMLTDPTGQVAELSTTSYRPTGPIWRRVVAEWVTCFEPACDAPAATAELDHRIPYPTGQTRPGNLWPGCKRGHTAKHAPGFGIEQAPDGSYRFRTRAGFTHPMTPPAQPASDRWPDWPDPHPDEADQGESQPFQFCATELLEALGEIRDRHDQHLAQDRELQWEHGTLLAGAAIST
jgi:hypothetical protein